MDILQNIKDAFKSVFPLHLNSTVEDLEDDLADAELELYFSKARLENMTKRESFTNEANNALRRENTYLSANLEQARQHIRVVQHELDEEYRRSVPNLDAWTKPASAHLDEARIYGSVIRVELPPLRLNCVIHSRHMTKGYEEAFAASLASTAYKEVKAAVADILNNLPPIKK